MNNTLKAVAALAALTGSVPALAEETAGSETSFGESMENAFATDWSKDFAVSAGMKLWFVEWNSWGIAPNNENIPVPSIPGLRIDNLVTTSISSSDQVAPIPVVSVKWKDLFVSGSYLSKTNFNFPSLLDTGRNATNYQWDVNLGYYVLPPYFALTVGYKDVRQTFGPTKYDIFGPTVGFVGAVPMKWGFSLYANFAYGFLEMQSEAFRYNGIRYDKNSDYWLIEAGVAYTYNLKEVWAHSLLSSATIQAGYRHQQIETSDVGGIVVPGGGRNTFIPDKNNTANDIMRGMVVGVNLSF